MQKTTESKASAAQEPAAPASATQEKKDPRACKKTVRVYRSNVDPDNKDMNIIVNDINGKSTGKKIFAPGQIVELTHVQLGILRDSVEETVLEIPIDSGIYSEPDKRRAAEEQYPGFTAHINQVTGVVSVKRRAPNYIIEPVEV